MWQLGLKYKFLKWGKMLRKILLALRTIFFNLRETALRVTSSQTLSTPIRLSLVTVDDVIVWWRHWLHFTGKRERKMLRRSEKQPIFLWCDKIVFVFLLKKNSFLPFLFNWITAFPCYNSEVVFSDNDNAD